jgi:hypothetical protein
MTEYRSRFGSIIIKSEEGKKGYCVHVMFNNADYNWSCSGFTFFVPFEGNEKDVLRILRKDEDAEIRKIANSVSGWRRIIF